MKDNTRRKNLIVMLNKGTTGGYMYPEVVLNIYLFVILFS